MLARLELHERARIGVGRLAVALGETRQAMARWLRQCEVPIHGRPRGWRHVLSDELRIYAPEIWRSLKHNATR